MKVNREKNCYCHTCEKWFHYLGITRHRAWHRDIKTPCKITFTHGDTYFYNYRFVPPDHSPTLLGKFSNNAVKPYNKISDNTSKEGRG